MYKKVSKHLFADSYVKYFPEVQTAHYLNENQLYANFMP